MRRLIEHRTAIEIRPSLIFKQTPFFLGISLSFPSLSFQRTIDPMGDNDQLEWLFDESFDAADPTNTSQLDYRYEVSIEQPESLLFQSQQASGLDNEAIRLHIATDYNAPKSPIDRIYGSPHGSIASGLSDDETLYTPASNVGGAIPELPRPSPSQHLTVPEWDYKHAGTDIRSLRSSMPPEAIYMYRDTQGWSPASSPSPNINTVFLDDDDDDFQGRLVLRRHSHSGYPSQGIPHPTPSNSSSPGLSVNGLDDLQLDDRSSSRTSSMIPASSSSTHHQVTLPIMFGYGEDISGAFLTSYNAPPFPQPSFNPEPSIPHVPVGTKRRIKGALRRRGPDFNSIKNRTKNVNPRPKVFCTFDGCNNLGFATQGTLKRHVNDKHTGKEHLCPMCSHMFADSTSVGRHQRDVHGKATLRRKK